MHIELLSGPIIPNQRTTHSLPTGQFPDKSPISLYPNQNIIQNISPQFPKQRFPVDSPPYIFKMPIFSSGFAAKVPYASRVQRSKRTFFPSHVTKSPILSDKNNLQNLTNLTVCLINSKSNQVNLSAPKIEEIKKMEFDTSSSPSETTDDFSKELEVAVKAVHMACLLCEQVQTSLVPKSSEANDQQVHSKDDNSPVTVAGKQCLLLS